MRATLGFEEAIERCTAFVDAGSDITFLEAPQTEAEMRNYCKNVSGHKMANLIENGKTPLLPIRNLEEMGYNIAVYALTLLNASIGSMQQALACLKQGEPVPGLMNFKTLRQIVGFDAYDAELDRYHAEK